MGHYVAAKRSSAPQKGIRRGENNVCPNDSDL